MKASVQLGLLCLSLLISSLHGEEDETDSSKQMPIKFEEPDLHQFEMQRVRRQAVNENTAVVEQLLIDNLRRKVRPGGLSPIGKHTPNNHRTKREDKVKKSKRKRPGMFSLLGSSGTVQRPQEAVHVKRDALSQDP